MSELAPLMAVFYSGRSLNPLQVYFMCTKCGTSVFYPSLTIRIFRFLSHPTECGVSFVSHGPGPREIVLIYHYLLCLHNLSSYSVPINEF